MAANQILQFGATASGGNLLTQAAYAADAQRLIGHQPGIARQELENKVLRQVSIVAAALAQVVADRQTTDIDDSMSLATLVSIFGANLGLRKQINYGAPGSTTFTVPAGVYLIFARVWGGGGGGGGVGAGGGGASGGAGGGYAEGFYAVTPGQVIPVVVGAGGSAGNGTPTNGGTGGTSSVGAFLSATGGAGGGSASGGSAAPVISGVGVGTGGQLNLNGVPSNSGLAIGGQYLGSAGGGSYSSQAAGSFSTSSGNGSTFPGSGGGGGGGPTFQNGFVGAGGLVSIMY